MAGTDFSDSTGEWTSFTRTNLIGSNFSRFVPEHTFFISCALHAIEGKPVRPAEAIVEPPDYSERGDGTLVVSPSRVLIDWGGSE